MPSPAAVPVIAPPDRLDETDRAATWLLVRRPLLVLLVFGFAVSLSASGRLTLRLIVDGALSFAFVPACQVLGLAMVYPFRARRALSFSSAVDLFFAGNAVWLWWMTAAMVAFAVVPVLNHGRLMSPLLVSLLIPIVWSVLVDRKFFREVIGHSGWRVALDITAERLVAWSAWWIYFFGAASDWRLGDSLYIFVEAWEMVAGVAP